VERRLLILAVVVLLGAAAPLRAWCEANCAVASTESTSHCPSHESTGDGLAVSASSNDDCPVLESARPTLSARLDAQSLSTAAFAPPLIARSQIAPSFIRPHRATTVFERSTPLRI
jgi:hypothetical protein